MSEKQLYLFMQEKNRQEARALRQALATIDQKHKKARRRLNLARCAFLVYTVTMILFVATNAAAKLAHI